MLVDFLNFVLKQLLERLGLDSIDFGLLEADFDLDADFVNDFFLLLAEVVPTVL